MDVLEVTNQLTWSYSKGINQVSLMPSLEPFKSSSFLRLVAEGEVREIPRVERI